MFVTTEKNGIQIKGLILSEGKKNFAVATHLRALGITIDLREVPSLRGSRKLEKMIMTEWKNKQSKKNKKKINK